MTFDPDVQCIIIIIYTFYVEASIFMNSLRFTHGRAYVQGLCKCSAQPPIKLGIIFDAIQTLLEGSKNDYDAARN